jgi:hypothetical protein
MEEVVMTKTVVECGTCGRSFELVPRVIPVPRLTEDQPPTQPLRFKRSNPCLKVDGVYIDYCTDECFKARDEIEDCWACGISNPTEEHTGRKSKVEDGLRCPGCCGPVYSNNFCSQEVKDRFTAYTCGTSTFDIRTHGSLAYIRPGDDREIQAALDEEFAKKQDRRDEAEEKYAAGDKSYGQRSCFGGLITSTWVPDGRLAATAHGVDCTCNR